jgi:hypothetical protein
MTRLSTFHKRVSRRIKNIGDSEHIDLLRRQPNVPHTTTLCISEQLVSAFYTTALLGSGISGDAIDGGANHGVHTRQLAFFCDRSGNRVIAAEPNIKLHTHIRESCAGEMLNNCVITDYAIWKENCALNFEICDSDSQYIANCSNIARHKIW